jgi:hypothetical protein
MGRLLSFMPHQRLMSTTVRVGVLFGIALGATWLDALMRPPPPSHFLRLTSDFASLYHIWMIGYLWSRGRDYLDLLSGSLSTLVANGAAQQPGSLVRRRIARVNTLVESRAAHAIILILSVLTCTAGTYAYSMNGAYGPIENGDYFHTSPYLETWATFPRFGFFAFILISSFGAYLIYWVGFVTVAVVGVWMRSHTSLTLQLAIDINDGRWGWGAAAALIDVGSKMLTVNIIGLAAIAWRGGFSQPQYFAFFPVVCLAGLIPYSYSNQLWSDALNNPISSGGSQIERALVAMIYAVAPKNLASTRTALYQVAFTILPGVLAIVSQVTKPGTP